IVGYLSDPAGAPIPGALVTVRGPALLQPATRTAGADGRFVFEGLPPGEGYALSAEVPELGLVERSGLVVRVGQTTPGDLNAGVMLEPEVVAAGTPGLSPGPR